jgi:ABC-type proline/glycine betaine transport system ATPase subunit
LYIPTYIIFCYLTLLLYFIIVFFSKGLLSSGKSTLLRCINRLIKASAGQIIIDGVDVLSMSPKELEELRKRKMSMVFQRFALLPHRNILDNVAYGLEVQGVKKEARQAKAREVIQMVGLSGWEESYPENLSGGMQQRVGIARALATDPDILLMDEPFSALDPLIRQDMQEELINIQEKLQKTIIFITHDLEELDFLGEGLQELRLLNWMESRVAVVEIELLGTVNNQEEEMEAIYELLSDLFTFNKKADSNIIYVYSKHLTIY